MAKPNNAARLADRYELSDLEPDVDPEKAAAFVAKAPAGRNRAKYSSRAKPVAVAPASRHLASRPVRDNQDLWTSRTIRIRHSTARILTKAACGQKIKQAEAKLKPGEPVSVQEIADHGIRLALAELGYDK